MAEPHPAASHYLPSFITAPGETDVLMVVMGLFLALVVVMFGVLFLRLHSLPDQIAHKSDKLQSEIVCVLCLIALFTHIHIFWIAALLLAMIDLPDFGTSLGRIADSTETMAGRKVRDGGAELPPKTMADVKQADAHEALLEKHGGAKQGSGPVLRRKDASAPSMGRLLWWRIRSMARGIIAALARWWQRLYSAMADRKVREGEAESPPKTMADVKQADAHAALHEKHEGAKQGNGPVLPEEPDFPQELPTPANPPAREPLRHGKGS
jgi:hypothetical protein